VLNLADVFVKTRPLLRTAAVAAQLTAEIQSLSSSISDFFERVKVV